MTAPRWLNTRGQRLAALEINPGPGAPIVLLHGFTHSIAFWRSDTVLHRFGHCWALSLPGHAPARPASGQTASDCTAEELIDTLAAGIRLLLGQRRATIAGVSTGGWAALGLAARHPDLVERVACISGFAQGRWTGVLGRWQAAARGGGYPRLKLRAYLLTARLLTERTFRANPLWPLSVAEPASLRDNPQFNALVRHMLPMARQLNIATTLRYLRCMPDIDISAWLPRISVPTLVLHGSRDPLVPFAQAQLIAQQAPNADLRPLEAGHLLAIEAPADYERELVSWLLATAPATPASQEQPSDD